MNIVYVSGPITGDGSAWARHCNLHRGLEVARDINALMPDQLGALSPHGNTYHMDGPGITWEQFLQLDLELIARLDGIVMMAGWQDSKGARRELAYAQYLLKPVFYWPLDRPRLMRWAAREVDYARGDFIPAAEQPVPVVVIEHPDKANFKVNRYVHLPAGCQPGCGCPDNHKTDAVS